MRFLTIVVPGMSDVPLSALEGKTPLEAGALPALDRLASRGLVGMARIAPEKSPTGSVVGLPALLGYDAAALNLRRGPLEAAGLGVSLAADDLALRLNFVSSFRGAMADTRAGHIGDREARVLLEALRRIETPLELAIHVGFGYRHLAVIAGGGGLQFDTLPPHEVLGQPLRDFYPYGPDADALMRFLDDAATVLSDHDVNRVRVDLGENPADAVWLWGEGVDRPVPPLAQRLETSAALVAGAPMVRGIARKAGMTCPDVTGATGDRTTSLEAKARVALELAESHEFVVVHVAAVNEVSRAGDAERKVAELERLDHELVEPLLRWVEEVPDERRLLVTPDHQTSVEAAVPNTDPVPFAIYGAGLEGVRDRPFTETTARASDLTVPDGGALLDFLLRGRARARGAGTHDPGANG